MNDAPPLRLSPVRVGIEALAEMFTVESARLDVAQKFAHAAKKFAQTMNKFAATVR